MKIPKPIVILFFTLSALFIFLTIRTLVWPLVSIGLNSRNQTTQEASVNTNAIPVENLAELLEERNSWDEFNFEDFAIRFPNFEEVESSENQKTFLITDPKSGETMTLQILREETDIETLEEIEPENELANYTLLSQYDALRIGPNEPPYSQLTYYILEDNFLYKIDVNFSTPVSFLDQILSTFQIKTADEEVQEK